MPSTAPPSGPPRAGRLRRSLGAVVRRDPALVVVLVASALLAVAYALWSWQRHRWYLTSGFDLGIFDQAAWRMAHLDWPGTTLRAEDNLWGDHLHPIIALWGALRALWPSPVALLASQAALVAAAMVPLYLFARDRIGRTAGLLVALAYGTSWGVQRAIEFDVHELAFAPVLLAGAVLAADRRRWPWFWACVALLLLVKENVPMLVVALGLWLLLDGERRRGALTIAAGVAWYLVATRLLIPAFADGREFLYWSYGSLGDDLPSALWELATHPWKLVTETVDPRVKLETIVALLAPFLFVLPWLTRLAVLPLPLLAERFLSDNPTYWTTNFHYSLLPTMALAIAAVGGIATVRRGVARATGIDGGDARDGAGDRDDGSDRSPERAGSPTTGPTALRTLPTVLAATGLLLGTLWWSTAYGTDRAPLSSMLALKQPSQHMDRDVLDRVVAATPRTGSIAAPRPLQPHLTGRGQDVYLLQAPAPRQPLGVARADNVVLNVVDTPAFDPFGDGWSDDDREVFATVERRIAAGDLVATHVLDDGWVVLRSPRAPGGARPDPALDASTGDDALALRRPVRAWTRATAERVPSCVARGCPPPVADAPRGRCTAGGCDGRDPDLVDRATADLVAALTARARRPGRCGALAGDLVPTVRAVAERYRAAAARPAPDTIAALRELQVRDVLHAPHRVALLCAPAR
ncbi:MAG: DUF2079 domain-containing protein [Solirubrobacteraceae bacterium]|nr:DUF2079 domain-containing protein [Solirubrobacteraceae bacterium]